MICKMLASTIQHKHFAELVSSHTIHFVKVGATLLKQLVVDNKMMPEHNTNLFPTWMLPNYVKVTLLSCERIWKTMGLIVKILK